MFIQAIIDGIVKKTWHHDNEILTGSLNEMGFTERADRWEAIAENCRIEMGEIGLDMERCQIVFHIKSMVQAKDVSLTEFREFNRLLKLKGYNEESFPFYK